MSKREITLVMREMHVIKGNALYDRHEFPHKVIVENWNGDVVEYVPDPKQGLKPGKRL